MESTIDKKITELVSLTHNRCEIIKSIYHYTSKDNINHIFMSDALSFQLTEVSNFDDKLEGKCCDVFYDIALEELADAKIITNNERISLERIKPTITGFMFRVEDSGEKYFELIPSMTYVGCFSSKCSDQYMINEYIKNEKHQGICIELRANQILNWKNEIGKYGYTVSVEKVLYGREVVEKIKDFITKLIQITEGCSSDLFRKFGVGLIQNELADMKYVAKSGKFRMENEYRIVLQVPQNINEGYIGVEFDKTEKGIIFKINKSALAGIEFVNMDRKTSRKYQHNLEKNGYKNIN